MHKTSLALLWTALFAALSGCTTADMYDTLQDVQRDRCQKLMGPDRDQCLRNNSTDYRTYEKQRRRPPHH